MKFLTNAVKNHLGRFWWHESSDITDSLNAPSSNTCRACHPPNGMAAKLVPPGVMERDTRDPPKPSILAVVTFYISIVFTCLGAIVVINAAFYVDEENQPAIFGLGICMVTAGIALIIITNTLSRREHDNFVTYIYDKGEEMQRERQQRFGNNTPGNNSYRHLYNERPDSSRASGGRQAQYYATTDVERQRLQQQCDYSTDEDAAGKISGSGFWGDTTG